MRLFHTSREEAVELHGAAREQRKLAREAPSDACWMQGAILTAVVCFPAFHDPREPFESKTSSLAGPGVLYFLVAPWRSGRFANRPYGERVGF